MDGENGASGENGELGAAASAPETTLVSAPAALSNAATVTFEFTSSGPASFECQLDGIAVACTSPYAAAVTEGVHTFQVTAIDASGVRDTTPALHGFTIDRTAPDTDLRGEPPPGFGSDPQFAFSSPDATASFECQLDATPFAPCTSPRSGIVAGGEHRFTVRAVDAAGNADPSPVSVTFSVEPTTGSTLSDSRTILCSDGVSAVACPTPSEAAYGQDGNILRRPEYTVTEETVLDSVSGLMWERSSAEPAVWDDQVARCAALTTGGLTDWRLPTRLETLTLIDAGRTAPALDTSVFLDVYGDYYWLGQELDGVPTAAWLFVGVDAGLSWNGKNGYAAARCVRGAPIEGSFTLSASGLTVHDSRTGATWQGTSSGVTLSWLDALSYCNALVLDGLSDWRLPSVKELQSLIDVGSGRNPEEIPLVFPGRDAVPMWTASPYPAEPSQSYAVDMSLGSGLIEPTATLLQARCVR